MNPTKLDYHAQVNQVLFSCEAHHSLSVLQSRNQMLNPKAYDGSYFEYFYVLFNAYFTSQVDMNNSYGYGVCSSFSDLCACNPQQTLPELSKKQNNCSCEYALALIVTYTKFVTQLTTVCSSCKNKERK